MDQQLYTTKGPAPNTVLWRPQKDSSVSLKPTDYRPFSQLVRIVHLNDAIDVCVNHCMAPKPVTSLSSLKAQVLPPYHPCKRLHVLWFGAQLDDTDEDAHTWYGNVEFAISTQTFLQRWNNYYLVEMVAAPTHSMTRILATNSDYSSVLPVYDPRRHGGGWYLTPDDRHEVLADCRRYNGVGYNRHGHTLEFMVEVTPFGMREILKECQISFRNHEEMAASSHSHVCHRFKGYHPCPTLFSRAHTSRWFFHEHRRLTAQQPVARPRLSPSAQESLHCFLTMEEVPRNNLPVLVPQPCPPPNCFSPYPYPGPPPFSDQHFPPLPPPATDFIISHFLQKRLDSGKVKKLHQMLGRHEDNVFRFIGQSISKSKMTRDEEEEENYFAALMICKRPHPRQYRPLPPPPPPPGFLPLPHQSGPSSGFLPPHPPPFDFPPLHLPPPPPHLPPIPFQHSWAPLQPIKLRMRN